MRMKRKQRGKANKNNRLVVTFLTIFAITSAVTLNMMTTTANGGSFPLDEEGIGKLCLAGAFPVSRGGDRTAKGEENTPLKEVPEITSAPGIDLGSITSQVLDTQEPNNPTPPTANVKYDKPLVIIYHTHATESYMPSSEGNFHKESEENTVRQVGDIMTAELEKAGIQVVHDKTLHDRPSYNQSYSRSLETIQSLMAQNPSAVFVVDLHRDAAGYAGGVGKTVLVNGETTAKYSLVVGQGNQNVNNLMLYANKINSKADSMYPGFGGRIIEKEYKYNQHVSDYHILLEIGNNENNIRDVLTTGKYFAKVLAEVIKDIEVSN